MKKRNLIYRDIKTVVNSMTAEELNMDVIVVAKASVYAVSEFSAPEDLGDIYPYRLYLDI